MHCHADVRARGSRVSVLDAARIQLMDCSPTASRSTEPSAGSTSAGVGRGVQRVLRLVRGRTT
jgi:hypothetical protein